MVACTCTKCGATATSKNPATRSVFMRDQELALKESAFPSYVENRDSIQGTTIVIQKPLYGIEELDVESAANYLKWIGNTLVNLAEDGKALQFLCEHNWVADHPEEITVW